MNQLDEYWVDDTKLYEWVPWGGFIHERVLRNKDDSLMAAFSYQTKVSSEHSPSVSVTAHIQDGWVLWLERQCFDGHIEDYLFVLWNPLAAAGHPVAPKEWLAHFLKVLQGFEIEMAPIAEIHPLAPESLLTVLYRAICFGKAEIPFPEIALYLDAYVTQDISFEILPNTFRVNHQSLAAYSVKYLEAHGQDMQRLLFDTLPKDYRFSRRWVCLSPNHAQRAMARYTKGWFTNRRAMRAAVLDDMLGAMTGFCTNAFFVFAADEQGLAPIKSYLGDAFQAMQIPYVEESRNFKETFWGSLPGLFRGNMIPPVTGTAWERFFLPAPQHDGGDSYV